MIFNLLWARDSLISYPRVTKGMCLLCEWNVMTEGLLETPAQHVAKWL